MFSVSLPAGTLSSLGIPALPVLLGAPPTPVGCRHERLCAYARSTLLQPLCCVRLGRRSSSHSDRGSGSTETPSRRGRHTHSLVRCSVTSAHQVPTLGTSPIPSGEGESNRLSLCPKVRGGGHISMMEAENQINDLMIDCWRAMKAVMKTVSRRRVTGKGLIQIKTRVACVHKPCQCLREQCFGGRTEHVEMPRGDTRACREGVPEEPASCLTPDSPLRLTPMSCDLLDSSS